MGAGGLASEADAVMGFTCGCAGCVSCPSVVSQDPSRLPCDRNEATASRDFFWNSVSNCN